jgi:hypothetical protein
MTRFPVVRADLVAVVVGSGGGEVEAAVRGEETFVALALAFSHGITPAFAVTCC